MRGPRVFRVKDNQGWCLALIVSGYRLGLGFRVLGGFGFWRKSKDACGEERIDLTISRVGLNPKP